MGKPDVTPMLIKPDGSPLLAKSAARPTARYLRDTRSGVIAQHSAPLTRHRDDVRASWLRVAGLAQDLLQNSGRIKGAADQVIADTVGVGLTLTPDPDLDGSGYDDEEKAAWIRIVKKAWREFWLSAREVDMRGKISGPQMVDIGLRWYMAFGEATGVFDFFEAPERQRYGIRSGTKLCMVPPPRLVQDTDTMRNLFQGVRHDARGRAVAYRFETSDRGLKGKRDFPAFDADGRPMVMHVFDPQDATDVRGISPLAPAFRKHIQADMLDDATLQMAILQTIYAVTLTSDAPSPEAFEALEALKEGEGKTGFATDYLEYLTSQLNQAGNSKISVGADPQVSHLAPSEKLELKTANVPGQDYLPFKGSFAREMARTIGITYGALTMDHSNATYSSVRMDNATLWPVVTRRRVRVAAPICQEVYTNWLDEAVGEGRVPFKGGYAAFRANRARICAASWQGPAKPTADDFKSARASTERLRNGTSSVAIETGDLGLDPDALFEERRREHQRYVEAGMVSPYAMAPNGQISQPAEGKVEEDEVAT